MILDGYTETREVGPLLVTFRPLLYHERAWWKQTLLRTGSEIQLDWLLSRRIYWWSSGAVTPEAIARLRADDVRLFRDLWRTVLGVGRGREEREDAIALRRSAELLSRWPHLWPDDICRYCRRWWYDPIANRTVRDSDGNRVERCGPLLCETREGCPRGHYERPVEIPDRHVQAFRHWHECRVCGFPDDGIVRRNARIISAAWTTFGRKSEA